MNKIRTLCLFALLLVAFAITTLPKPVMALEGELNTVLAFDMEQIVILPDNVQTTGMPQGSYLFDGSPYRNHGEPLPYTLYPYNSSGYTGPEKVSGFYGYALSFDGTDDYVNVPDHNSLDLTTEVTWSCWVYPQSTGGDIVGKSGGAGSRTWAVWIQDNNYTRVRLSQGGTNYVHYEGNTTIAWNEWTHLAWTFDGSAQELTFYVNGLVDVTRATNQTSMHTNAVDVSIGKQLMYEYFNGSIDEVRIYPEVLTQRELVQDMNTPIRVYVEHRIPYFYDEDDGWDTSPTNPNQIFKFNDPYLPSVTRDATTTTNRILQRAFVPGFQQYRFRAVFNQTQTSGSASMNGFEWKVYTFKNAEYQVRYTLRLIKNHNAPLGDQWIVDFYQQRNEHTAESWSVNVFQVLPPGNHSQTWPFTIDIWVTPDGQQMGLRVTSENATQTEDYYYVWYYDLVDKDGNPHYIEWFDGWVVIDFITSGNSHNGVVCVESHRSDLFASITQFFVGVGETIINFLSPATQTVTQTITEVVEPVVQTVVKIVPKVEVPSIFRPETIIDTLTGWQRAILDIPQKLWEGFTALINALTGPHSIWHSIYDLFMAFVEGVNTSIATAPLTFWNVFVNFLDTIFSWAGWANGFSETINLVSQFIGWTATAILELPTILINVMVGVYNILTYFVDYFVDFISDAGTWYANLQWMWGYMEQYVGWVPQVLGQIYPLIMLFFGIWLISPMIEQRSLTRGFEGVQRRMNLTIGTLVKVGTLLWKIIEFTSSLVYRLIESVPIAE